MNFSFLKFTYWFWDTLIPTSLEKIIDSFFITLQTNLTGDYTRVINDMKKVEEWRSSTTTREIASQMVSFIEARLDLMKLYEQIANEG